MSSDIVQVYLPHESGQLISEKEQALCRAIAQICNIHIDDIHVISQKFEHGLWVAIDVPEQFTLSLTESSSLTALHLWSTFPNAQVSLIPIYPSGKRFDSLQHEDKILLRLLYLGAKQVIVRSKLEDSYDRIKVLLVEAIDQNNRSMTTQIVKLAVAAEEKIIKEYDWYSKQVKNHLPTIMPQLKNMQVWTGRVGLCYDFTAAMLTDNTNELLIEEQSAESVNPPELLIVDEEARPLFDETNVDNPFLLAQESIKSENSPGESKQIFDSKDLKNQLSLQKIITGEGTNKKEDTERQLTLFLITRQRRQEIEKLFTPPPGYFAQLKPLLERRQRIGIVYGPDYAECKMCAEHLGFLLTRQIYSSEPAKEDPYIGIEQRIEELLTRLRAYPEYSRAITLRDTLDLNLRRTRANAEDNPELRFERNQILLQLNNIALSTLGVPLKQMRQEATKETKRLRTVSVFDWSREDSQPLTELVKQMDEDDVYIVRRPVEFDPRFGDQLAVVSSHLVKCKATLIFVQNSAEPSFYFEDACYIAAYPPLGTSVERSFITEVFLKYFLYFGSVIPAETLDLLDELVTIYLKSRFSIAGLIDELRSLEDGATKEQIQAVAEGMGKLDARYARHCFQSWSYNHRIYAMLIVLFIDVPRPILDRIYTAAVSELRDSGITTLQDPRQFGMDGMLQTIRVQEDEHRISFQYAVIETEVERQINNHHHLLWPLLKIILGWVDQYRAPEYWQLRKSLGAALGRMGLHQTEELTGILDNLARHPSGGVVAVAGYALDCICRIAPDQHEMVVQILRRWAESGDPDLMWATGASIWRIYDSLIEMAESDELYYAQRGSMTLDKVSEILTTFVQTFKHFNGTTHYQLWQKAEEEKLTRLTAIEFVLHNLTAWAAANLDAILHAVRQIAWKHPARMVVQIRAWLQAEESENQKQIGLLAGYQLFEMNSRPDVPLSALQQLPLLGLIQPLLRAQEEFEEKQRTVDMLVQALLHWVTHSDWSEEIQEYLFYSLDHSTIEISDILCDSIARHWVKSDLPQVQQIGHSLIRRAFAIHRIPSHPSQDYLQFVTAVSTQEPLVQLLVLILPSEEKLNLLQVFDRVSELQVLVGIDNLKAALVTLCQINVLIEETADYHFTTPTLPELYQNAVDAEQVKTLARQVRIQNPIYMDALRFFLLGGYVVQELDNGELLLTSKSILREHFNKVYTRLVANQALRAVDIRAIEQAARVAWPEESGPRIAFVVTDRKPETAACFQIYTLRAELDFTVIPLSHSLLRQAMLDQRAEEVLENQIRFHLGETDLYAVSTPVTDVLRFFGRAMLIDEILNRFDRGQHVGIFGLRKLGKTSLLWQLRERLRRQAVAYVDLQAVARLDTALYTQIINLWDSDIRFKYPGLTVPALLTPTAALPPIEAFRQNFLELKATLAEQETQPHFVLMLDEIERLPLISFQTLALVEHTSDESLLPVATSLNAESLSMGGRRISGYNELIALLRGLAQQDGGLTVLVAGVDPHLNRTDRWGEVDNPMYRFFQEIFLPPLTEAECCEMVTNIGQQMGIQYTDATLARVYAESGGHPFLARELCSAIIKPLLRPAQVDDSAVTAGVEAYLLQPNSYLESLWEERLDTNEQTILLRLANEPSVARETFLSDLDTRRAMLQRLGTLTERHLLHEEAGVYHLAVALFRRWIRYQILGIDFEEA